MADSNIMDIRKNLFKNVVTDYDYARPPYPSELYKTIHDFSGIGPGSNILEVGAGTGQATKLFVEKNHSLDLLEVSDEEVDFLRGKYEKNINVRIFKDYFEDFKADWRYDLIYSATAFHWIKCENGYPKAWEILRDGGTMAVFWNMFWELRRKEAFLTGSMKSTKSILLPVKPMTLIRFRRNESSRSRLAAFSPPLNTTNFGGLDITTQKSMLPS